jgi:mannosyltransferase OCH1-like enzyme
MLVALLCLLVFGRVGMHLLLREPQPELADLMRLDGDSANSAPAVWRLHGASASAQQLQKEQQPKLVPRIIHQTHAGGTLHPQLRQYMHSWRRMNPGWEVRLYTDQVRRRLANSSFVAMCHPACD